MHSLGGNIGSDEKGEHLVPDICRSVEHGGIIVCPVGTNRR